MSVGLSSILLAFIRRLSFFLFSAVVSACAFRLCLLPLASLVDPPIIVSPPDALVLFVIRVRPAICPFGVSLASTSWTTAVGGALTFQLKISLILLRSVLCFHFLRYIMTSRL